MNFIRKFIIGFIKLFMSEPQPIFQAIDESKIYGENSDDEIPELPKEFIPEPFYSTMLNEDLVENPPFVQAQMPMALASLEPQRLVDTAMGTDRPHLEKSASF